jgi:hypothetical protein
MNKDENRDFARLESKVDLLETELSYLDTMLKKSGFPNGISTLKETVEELLAETNGKAFMDIDFEGLFE